MWEYYHLLRLRHRHPVIPIVLYLSPGAGGLVEEQHIDGAFGKRTSVFTYSALGLPDLKADTYAQSDNPLAGALSVMMRSDHTNRAVRRLRAFERVAAAKIDEAHKELLAEVITRYSRLAPEELEEWQELSRTAGKEVKAMITLEERFRRVGREEGIEQGIEQGALSTRRAYLMRVLTHRFGELPPGVAAGLERLSNPMELDNLLDRALDARSLDELGLEA